MWSNCNLTLFRGISEAKIVYLEFPYFLMWKFVNFIWKRKTEFSSTAATLFNLSEGSNSIWDFVTNWKVDGKRLRFHSFSNDMWIPFLVSSDFIWATITDEIFKLPRAFLLRSKFSERGRFEFSIYKMKIPWKGRFNERKTISKMRRQKKSFSSSSFIETQELQASKPLTWNNLLMMHFIVSTHDFHCNISSFEIVSHCSMK